MDNIREILLQAASETLETMAFMEVESTKEFEQGPDVIGVEIHVIAPESIRFSLYMHASTLQEINENIHGGSETPNTKAALTDVLSELLNIMAGAVMRERSPQGFELGLPQEIDPTPPPPDAANIPCILACDGAHSAFYIHLH